MEKILWIWYLNTLHRIASHHAFGCLKYFCRQIFEMPSLSGSFWFIFVLNLKRQLQYRIAVTIHFHNFLQVLPYRGCG